MPKNSNNMNLPSNFRGTQIGEFEGGKIYTDGIQHGAVSISANLFGFSFGTEYDTITGGFNTPTSKSVTNGPLKLDVDNNGNIKTGVVAGAYEGGLVTYSDGSRGFYAGASLRAKLADIGISVDGTLPEHNTNLSTYNSTTVFSNGTVIKTEYRTVNKVGFESGVAAYVTNYKNGKFVSVSEYPVDSTSAAQMASGLAPHCFTSGTLITMASSIEKAIETIRPGDFVASFNERANGGRGALVGKRVVRTFVNENQIVIDFHGTKVTPGHAYLCGDGQHEGRFRQVMNIIRDDGAVVLADGTLMRAATGCPAGSAGDAFIEVQIAHPGRNKETGEAVTLLKERGCIRVGTRVQRPDGSSFSFLDLIESNGWTLQEDGLVKQQASQTGEPLLYTGWAIPKPEDYILSLSQLTLADLYDDPRQVETPKTIGGAPQGEANAVVLQAATSSDANEAGERSPLSLRSAVRTVFGARKNRAPKHAGETVH